MKFTRAKECGKYQEECKETEKIVLYLQAFYIRPKRTREYLHYFLSLYKIFYSLQGVASSKNESCNLILLKKKPMYCQILRAKVTQTSYILYSAFLTF